MASTGEAGLWALQTQELHFAFPLFSPDPHPCSKTKLVPENSLLSLLSCNPPASTFSPSSLFSEEVWEKFPPVHLLRDVRRADRSPFRRSYSLPTMPPPTPVPRGTGAAGLTKASGDGRFHRGFFNVLGPLQGQNSTAWLPRASSLTSHCASDNRRTRRLEGRQCLEKLQSPSLLRVLLQRRRVMELILQLHWAAPMLLHQCCSPQGGDGTGSSTQLNPPAAVNVRPGARESREGWGMEQHLCNGMPGYP